MMTLTRPRRQYAPLLPATGGAMMAPPEMSTPAPYGGGHTGTTAAAPYMPIPAAPVVTNPRMTPFQLSVNQQRAREAQKAKSFAAASPLPMTPGQAQQPQAPYIPTAPLPENDASYSYRETGLDVPVNGAASTPTTSPGEGDSTAPAYNGSFANAEQAQAARAAYIGRQNDTINAQDLGPGIGLNSLTNTYNAAHPHIDPLTQAKIDSQTAWQKSQGTWQNTIAPSIATQNYSGAGVKDAQAGKIANDVTQSNQMLPYKQRESDATTGLKTAQAGAATSNAASNAERVKQTGATAQAKQQDAATKQSQTEAARPHLEKMRTLQKQMEAIEKGIANPNSTDEQRLNLNKRLYDFQQQHDAAMKDYAKARGIGGGTTAKKPGGVGGVPLQNNRPGTVGGGPATQPSASAGQLNGHDPQNLTPENLQHTASLHGITVEEVKRRLQLA